MAPTIEPVSFEEAVRLLGSNKAALALDLETYDFNRPGGSLDPKTGEIRLLSMCSGGKPPVVIDHLATPIPPEPLTDFLRGRELIFHNAPFDLAWLKQKFGFPYPAAIWDTLTAARLLSNGTGLSNELGATLERSLGIRIDKALGTSDFGGLFLTEAQLEYALHDVAYLHALREWQRTELAGTGMTEVFNLETKLLPVVEHLETAGWYILPEPLQEEIRTCTPLRDRVAARLEPMLGPINFNSDDEVITAFSTRYNIELSKTNETVLTTLGHPAGLLLLEFRSLSNRIARASLVLASTQSDGRVYTCYNPLGARSGRFTSSGPNLQQINREGLCRAGFGAPPGRVLIVLDYAQIELMVAAYLSQDPVMLAAIKAGTDLHKQTAALILAIALVSVTKAHRQTAKAVNFGLLFGQGAAGLVNYARVNYGVTLSLDEAERFRKRFFSHYTGLKAWHAQAWLRAPFVTEGRTILGRRRLPAPDATDWDRFQLLVNHSVQGSSADGKKRALVRLFAELPPEVKIIGTVHDEAVLEANTTNAHQVAAWATNVMVREMTNLLPGIPVKVEHTICERWSQKQ
jgi:DNA polymerase I-like protein with 3'-5' exonuclease and polymerase domains